MFQLHGARTVEAAQEAMVNCDWVLTNRSLHSGPLTESIMHASHGVPLYLIGPNAPATNSRRTKVEIPAPGGPQRSKGSMDRGALWEEYVQTAGDARTGKRLSENFVNTKLAKPYAGKLNKAVMLSAWKARSNLYRRTASIELHRGVATIPLLCVRKRRRKVKGTYGFSEACCMTMEDESLKIQFLSFNGKIPRQPTSLDTSKLDDIEILEDPTRLTIWTFEDPVTGGTRWTSGLRSIVNTAGAPVSIENDEFVLKSLNRFNQDMCTSLAVVISDAILSCLLSETRVQCTCTYSGEEEAQNRKNGAGEQKQGKNEEKIMCVWEPVDRTRDMGRSVQYASRDSLAIAIKSMHFKDPELCRVGEKQNCTLSYFDIVQYVRCTLHVLRHLNGGEERDGGITWIPEDGTHVYINAIALFMDSCAKEKALRQVRGLPTSSSGSNLINLSDLKKEEKKESPLIRLQMPDLADDFFSPTLASGLSAMEIGRRRILLVYDGIDDVAHATRTREIPESGVKELSRKMQSGEFLKPSWIPLFVFITAIAIAALEFVAVLYVFRLCTYREEPRCESTLVTHVLTILGSVILMLNVARELLCPGTPWKWLLQCMTQTRLVSDLIREDMKRGLIVARPLDGYLTPTHNTALTNNGDDLHGAVPIKVGDMEEAGSIVTEGLAIVPTINGVKMMRVEGTGKQICSMRELEYSKEPDEIKLYRPLRKEFKIA